MSSQGIARVRYFDRQILRLAEFVDEQHYHLSMMRRHNISAHIWGIVYGLEITQSKDGTLSVQPGMAVDGYGRVLLLPAARGINPNEFENRLTDVLDVWFVYNQQESNLTEKGFSECGVEGQAQRLQEIAAIIVRVPSDPSVDTSTGGSERRQPENLSPADLAFNPTIAPPDSPNRPWPVYLGQVQRLPTKPVTYAINHGGRPYAGLVGEWVRAPSGRAWMQIGAEVKDDPYRFAVFLPETKQDRGQPFPPPGLLPRLAIRADRTVEVRGDTTVDGSITLNGGALEFGVGPATSGPLEWSMYHVNTETNANQGDEDQLRIEMPEPPDAQNVTAKVVIGYFSTLKKQFVPCLTIDNQCNVRVHGNLIVQSGCSENAAMAFSMRALQGPAAPRVIGQPIAGGAAAAGEPGELAQLRGFASQLKEAGMVPQFLTLLQSDPELAQTIAAFRIAGDQGAAPVDAEAIAGPAAPAPAEAAAPQAPAPETPVAEEPAAARPPAEERPKERKPAARRSRRRKPPAQEGGG